MGVGGGQGWAGGRGSAALLLSRAPSCRRPRVPGCTAMLAQLAGRAVPGCAEGRAGGPGCIAPALQAVTSR